VQASPRIALSVDSHIGEPCLSDLREAIAAARAKRPGKYTGK
jgi:hypothetical protein